MSKRSSGNGAPKPPKPPKTPKPPKAPKAPTPPEPETDEDERVEEFAEFEDAADDDDGPDIEIEVEVDGKGKFGKDFPFGKDGIFGRDGPFGPKGPFGDDGPFGRGGLFGPQGLFGQGGIGGGKRRHQHRQHSGPHGPRRRGRMFGAGELRLVLLALIAEEARHGYDCIKALEEATDGAYAPSPGVVYPTLQMLLDEGLILEQASEDSRKVYEATEAGMAELEANKAEIEALLERLGRRAKRASAAKSSDMMRAMGNLAAVLTNAATQGKLTSANREQIVDMIDGLARKIERL